ncbi:MAG: 2-C-methyl-D-erythritol 4-phosphate cytidylyltransferase [Syntrophomonadaceae bacterium]|jgi:2-C-methyl-D-erythritol 4-phosphate cytidylyltransferase|nr:2-C-methyl-D-erythritol 4-phosphate cytidylyltransferase [Syntrophomonadaceae bacterium]
MEYSAIILAGGAGTRMKQASPKQFLLLAGKPMFMHTLERLEKISSIKEIILVSVPQYRELLAANIDAYMLQKKYLIVDGGESRQQSVLNGILAASQDNVIIHEAARPFVTTDEFQALIDEPCEDAIYGADIPFTVLLKKNGFISNILERSELLNVQLPQKFGRQPILDVHQRAAAEGKRFTEDASMLYYYTGREIKILPGSHCNIKVTEPIDLILGEFIYKEYIIGRD